MKRRLALLLAPALAVPLLGTGPCTETPIPIVQEIVTLPGYVEPHTPGSGAPEQIAPTAKVVSLLGATPNLNRVTYLRTALATSTPDTPPRAILILVPGFLGGAATFQPLAKQLVRQMNGQLEVWAIDRRPNQLEDRLGSFHAQAKLANGDLSGLVDGFRFYFPGADVDGDGNPDDPITLEDSFGVQRGYLAMDQDDMRFAAYWGLDTQVRDWKILVDAARAEVGPEGLVLFGGHSAGTGFAGIFAAYDFDPGPGVIAGHDLIDGVLLLEGGGPGAPSASAPSRSAYLDQVTQLATPGGPAVFLASFQGIEPRMLGPAAEIAGLAGLYDPFGPSIAVRTPIFRDPPFSFFFQSPMTNETAVGLFIDDDYQLVGAFRASVGFSDNGDNAWSPNTTDKDGFYIAQPAAGGALRTWKQFDDPTLPACPPNAFDVGVGCALRNNGPEDSAKPFVWGNEREVTDLHDILRIQFQNGNFAEWYYLAGRQSLDGQYGRDSSSLGDDSLLAVTQNATMDKPVLVIGGSNGLLPLYDTVRNPQGAVVYRGPDDYLGSIATPPADKRYVTVEGYAHLDLLTAKKNDAVPIIKSWVSELIVRKTP